MGERPRLELLESLAELYECRRFADLTIVTRDGARHQAHRALLCPRSSYFADVVQHEAWLNGTPGEIGLDDDDPDVVAMLLQYFYTLNYEPKADRQRLLSPDTPTDHSNSDAMSERTAPVEYGHVYGTSAVSAFGGPLSPAPTVFRHRDRNDSSLTVHALPGMSYGAFSAPVVSTSGGRLRHGRSLSRGPEASPWATEEPRLSLHARMYAAGEKYHVYGLKALALDKFKIQLTRHWDSPEMAEAIHVVFNSTVTSDREMREAVADVLGWHPRLLDKPEIEVAIMEINGLAYELLKRSRRAEPEFVRD